MVNKDLSDSINKFATTVIRQDITIPAKSAGEAGNIEVPISTPRGWENAVVLSCEFYTSSIANMRGMQISFVAFTATVAWINYYAPIETAGPIAGQVRLTLRH